MDDLKLKLLELSLEELDATVYNNRECMFQLIQIIGNSLPHLVDSLTWLNNEWVRVQMQIDREYTDKRKALVAPDV